MAKVILGKKGRMSQVFTEEGVCIPVTILEVGPCWITKVLEDGKDGYGGVQFGFEEVRDKVLSKAEVGHCKASGAPVLRHLREVRLDDPSALAVDPVAGEGEEEAAPGTVEAGARISVSVFQPGDRLDVIGNSKGRGHAGVMKRHNFSGGRMTHGGMARRRPGSLGASAYPGRVIKGKKMAGRYGGDRNTIKNVEVVQVIPERNLLVVKGPVPGHRGTLLYIRDAKSHAAKS